MQFNKRGENKCQEEESPTCGECKHHRVYKEEEEYHKYFLLLTCGHIERQGAMLDATLLPPFQHQHHPGEQAMSGKCLPKFYTQNRPSKILHMPVMWQARHHKEPRLMYTHATLWI